MVNTSDDNVMMMQIVDTHVDDGIEVDVGLLLQCVGKIFHHCTVCTATTLERALHAPLVSSQTESFDQSSDSTSVGDLPDIVHKISYEISCKCSAGGDAYATTEALLNTQLSSYKSDAKVVLALAAFALTYGEFWLVAELCTNHPLANSMALLKQLPDISHHWEMVKPRLEQLSNLIKAMLDMTKCIVKCVEFNEQPRHYISPNQPHGFSVDSTHISAAVHCAVSSVVAGASQIIGLIRLGHEYILSSPEDLQLSSVAHEVKDKHEHLEKQLALCYQHIDEKKRGEACCRIQFGGLDNAKDHYTKMFIEFVKAFIDAEDDNMKILKALTGDAEDNIPPLLEGSTGRRVRAEVLRRKNVLLLISDLDILQEELSIMEQMYRESREQPTRVESQYEVVWLPVVDRSLPWTDTKQRDFDRLQSSMPWYSVHHPLLIDPPEVKFIKKIWHFNKKPILVVLDPQGSVVNPNALHMLSIWGSLAFPFTSLREEHLWKEETWRLELLVDGIDPHILNWITEERFVCLYGGEDIDWIRKFTTTARGVAQAALIPFEMVYVGKSNPKERVRSIINIITTEKLSHCWPDLTSIWFFWVRLKNMWYSKKQQGRTIENDRIMQEIMTMLTFGGSEQGWALISKGLANMIKAKGDAILTCFLQYDLWKESVDLKGFLPALGDHLQLLHTPHHCNHLILPGTVGRIPEMPVCSECGLVCSECGRPMEKYLMYRCCTD